MIISRMAVEKGAASNQAGRDSGSRVGCEGKEDPMEAMP
jgi:hypothetical protein